MFAWSWSPHSSDLLIHCLGAAECKQARGPGLKGTMVLPTTAILTVLQGLRETKVTSLQWPPPPRYSPGMLGKVLGEGVLCSHLFSPIVLCQGSICAHAQHKWHSQTIGSPKALKVGLKGVRGLKSQLHPSMGQEPR